MPAFLLLLALSVSPAALNDLAARVAQIAAQAVAAQPGDAGGGRVARATLRVEDAANLGGSEHLVQALRRALAAQKIDVGGDAEAAVQVEAFLASREGRPIAVVRVQAPGRDAHILFAALDAAGTDVPASAGPALAIRTRTLFTSDLPVLDLDADAAGNLFVLHPDRLRVRDLNAAGLPLKNEVGLETGAERLRDPLARLAVNEAARQIAIYGAAASLAPAPPIPFEGYTLKSFPAATPWRVVNPWRSVAADIQMVAGRNYFHSAAAGDLYALAPAAGVTRSHWAVLSVPGRLWLADPDMRPLIGSSAPGTFGGDVASVPLACAGTVILAPGDEAAPARDRISVLRVENDRLVPYSSVEVEGAIYRLKALPSSGEQHRVLAVTQRGPAVRVEEIELQCSK